MRTESLSLEEEIDEDTSQDEREDLRARNIVLQTQVEQLSRLLAATTASFNGRAPESVLEELVIARSEATAAREEAAR